MNPYESPEVGINESVPAVAPETPGMAHVLSGWPLLLLLFVGGAIGGCLGGAAYAINMQIYRSNLPVVAKIALNLFTGLCAFLLWLAIGLLIQTAMN